MKTPIRLAAVAALCAAALTACGDGGSTEPSPSIKIGLVQAQDFVHAMPARVAVEQGFFKAEGLDVSVVDFSAGSDLTKAMTGGSIDVGAATGLDAVSGAAKNLQTQAFYGVMAKSPMALIVPKDSAITGFSGMSGKKIGISKVGSLTDYVTRATAEASGVPFEKVKEVPLGTPSATMSAMKRGDIDGFILPVNFGFSCSLSGETVQSARTSAMVYDVPELLVRLSRVCRLFPGDLVFTGTPSGVGNARSPKRFIRPGEVLVSELEGVGRLTQRFVAGGP